MTAGIAVGANLLLSLWLMTLLDAAGLALATALAAMLNGGILVALLHRRVGRVDWNAIGTSALRVLMACIPVMVICLGVAAAPIWEQDGQWLLKSVVLVAGIGLSIIAYLGAHILLGSDELDVATGMVKRTLSRKVPKWGKV